VETVAQLNKDFAWIDVMSATESKTVDEEGAAVGNVDGVNIGGEAFA
jgi:hypothetical protein